MSVSARADVAGSVARLAWVDRLKVATIAGVVVVHVATAYVVDIGWYYEERTSSQVTPVVLGVPAFLGGVFGLAPLFLVGGWMAAGSLARRGAGPFARARLVRLGVPTLLYFLLVDPFADYLGGRVQGESRTLADYLTDIGGDRDLGPVWFITVLLVLSLAYAAWRRLRPPQRRPGPLTWRILAVAALGIAVADLVLWLRWSYFSHTLWNLNWQHWAQAAGVFAVAIAVLEMFNYVAHYGLIRERDAGGRLEPFAPHHSWNSSNVLANPVIFNMGRHSDHHTRPSAPYQMLRHIAEAPELPAGYAGSILLALVPPLWRRIMDPKVEALRA